MAQAERWGNPEGSALHRPLTEPSTVGDRYIVYGEIASGGMATVQYGKLRGPHGFARAVAIKRLHPHFAKEAEFLSMFIDEARLSARLMHANIIHTLDVIQAPDEIALVMEYVHGESLWTLLRLAREQGKAVPLPVATALLASTLHGLHAAHEARGEDDQPLQIVHRDVSPANILVGSDGIPRVLDFGIAKAMGRLHATPSGEIKGKLGYIAPEQLHAAEVDRRTDVYGAATVLWEALTGSRLFDGPSEPAIVHRVLYGAVDMPSVHRKEIPAVLDAIVRKGLSRDMAGRFQSAQEMALALERGTRLASQSEIAAWLEQLAGAQLKARARRLNEMSQSSERTSGASPQPSAAGGTRRIQAAPVTPDDDMPTLVIATNDPMLRPSRGRAWAISAAVAVLAITAAAWAVSAAPLRKWWEPSSTLESVQAPEPAPSATSPQPPAAEEPELPFAPLPVAAEPAREEPKHSARRASTRTAPAAVQPPAAADPIDRALAPLDPTAFDRAAVTNAPALQVVAPVRIKAPVAPQPTMHSPPAHPEADPCVPFYRIDERGIRHPKPECI